MLFSVFLIGSSGFAYASFGTQNMYVSTANTLFDHSFAGPMITEVVIIDSDIDYTDELQGEPDVTVNGKSLRMVQAVDGNWYAYFAARDMAQTADSTVGLPGFGLDYGEFCQSNSLITGIDLTEAEAFAIPRDVASASNGNEALGICDTEILSSDVFVNHVLRESKQINTNPLVPVGQVGLDEDAWPFIQLFDFTVDGNVEVKYNKAGSIQQITLVYLDETDYLTDYTLNGPIFPNGAEVHITITDLMLNIDPTDEDSWTFGTNQANPIIMYQAFDEHGVLDADGTAGAVNIFDRLYELHFQDNGVMILDTDASQVGVDVINLEDNDNQAIIGGASASGAASIGGSFAPGTMPVTITETQGNSATFTTYDEGDKSNIVITSDGLRGTVATFDYNDTPSSILIGYDFGTIDIQVTDGTWNSGEEASVILADADGNLNSLVDEDLDLFNPDVKSIPALQLGTPFTLESLSDVQLSGSVLTIDDVQQFSQRAMLKANSDISVQNGDTLTLTLGDTFSDLYVSINESDTAFSGFNYFNYDLRSIENNLDSIGSFDVDITDGTNTTRLASDVTDLQGFFDISGATGFDIFAMNSASPVQLKFTFDTSGTSIIPADTVMPIVVDFFSFGIINDGVLSDERINNIILRVELEEAGDNTGTFEGTLAFVMTNQLNVLDSSTYENHMDPISDDLVFVVHQGLIDENSPRVNYFDLGADGMFIQIADHQEAPSHSGIASFDSSTYEIGDRVDVTLVDPDLNLSPEFFDVYAPVSPSFYPTDPARDTVGKANLPEFSFGPLGRLLDITINDNVWTSGLPENGGACNEQGTPDDGLYISGFALIETDPQSGIFEGEFELPETYCNAQSGQIESTSGTDMFVRYLDFRNGQNQIFLVENFAYINTVETEPLYCDDLSLNDLIASGNYNVIDNRDGHLDGITITGTNGDDLILASDAGNDIRAKKGNDCVIGGAGNDQLRGGNGDDTIFGLDGNDKLIGGKHNDVLYGGNGNDIVNGGNDTDSLSCGDGTDRANGGKGTDTATADCERVRNVP